MSSESNNNGWVKLTDPKSGRVFYANNITRSTQWEAPAGFVDDSHRDHESVTEQRTDSEKKDAIDDHITNSLAAVAAATKQSSLSQHQHNSVQKSATVSTSSSLLNSSSSLPLPSNWEMRHDPKSNRPFYIDHDSKVTTWEHPLKNLSSADIAAIMNESNNNDSASERYDNALNSRLYATNPQHSQTSRMSFSSTTSRNSFSSATQDYQQPSIMSKDGESSQYYKRLQSSNHHFSVIEIPDSVRTICPSCKMPFSTLNRRHHCRSCGDVFCHDCSKHKVLLPLDGEKYKTPVRICNSCHVDVSRGDYFTMRRYWTIFDVFNENEYQNKSKSMDSTQAAIALIAQEEDGNISDYEGGSGVNKGKGTEIIRPENVSAAFISFTQDLDTLLETFHEDDGRSFKEKLTLNPKILLHLITKHLILEDTSDVAVKTLATLLSLSNVVYGHDHEDLFVHAFYLLQLETSRSLSLGTDGIDSSTSGSDKAQMLEKSNRPCNVWNDLCKLLEWYGTSSKTIAVQEQTARTLFYLTDPKVISTFLAKEDDHLSDNMKVETEKSSPYPSYGEVEDGWATKAIEYCDVHRLLKNLLDHTTSTGSTSLQRWSAASFQNLITEDFRRACDAITNAMLCGNGNGLAYESYMFQLISSGGIMILSSLMGADDSDVRAHATATLSSVITNVRDLNRRLDVWREATGGTVKNGSVDDIAVISAIVSSGACGLSLTQLLLSADNSTAIMGCNFALSLVQPILQSPFGSELVSYQRTLNVTPATSTGDFYAADDPMSTYRKAAMELAKNDGILPALIQLAHNNDSGGRGRKRSLELWSCAMDVLAAIVLTISHLDAKISQSKCSSEDAGTVANEVQTSLLILKEEDLGQVLLESLSSIRINAINVSRDSPAAKVRESASLILSATSSCSRCNIVDDLIMSNVMTDLITASAEEGMSSESTFRRGTWAPRYLAMLEAVASVLVYGWKVIQNEGGSSTKDKVSRTNLTASSALDLLLEAIDAGIIPFVSYIIESKIDYNDHDKAHANMRLKIAGLTSIAALFGICQSDKTSIGMPRLYEAVYANTGPSNDNMGYPTFNNNIQSTRYVNQRDVISSLLILLRTIVSESHQNISRTTEHQYHLPHGKLVESCLLAAGSVCGSSFCPFNSFLKLSTNDFSYVINTNNVDDQFLAQFEEVSKLSCDTVTASSFLPSALVGVFGEGTILPSLRFILALAQHGSIRVHQKLAKSGMLVPISDMMSDSLASGDFYVFTLTVELVGLCGSQISASAGESTGLKSIRNSVQLLSNVLCIKDRNNAPSGEKIKFKQLKKHCVRAIERLSVNSSTLSVIASSFVPAISISFSPETILDCSEQFSHVLRIIQRVVSIPTYAKAVIDSGIVKSLSELISDNRVSDELDHVIIEVIHTLVCHTVRSREYENEKIGLIQHGAVKAICFSLMKHTRINSGAIVSSSILTAKLGFEALQHLLSGIKNIDKVLSLQATCFVKAITPQQKFIKTLCCTLLTQSEDEKLVAKSLYGDPLILFDDNCATFSSPFEAAVSVLFSIASLCTMSTTDDEFWNTFLLLKESELCVDEKSKACTVFMLCSAFLEYISDKSSFLYKPTSTTFEVTQHLKYSLQGKIIDGLILSMNGMALRTKEDEDILCFLSSMVGRYEIIQISLGLCKIPILLDKAMELIKMVFLGCEDAFFSALGSNEQSFVTLFDLLDSNSVHTRKSVAHILSKAGERDILGPIISTLRLRNIAIASLSTACLREEEYSAVGIEQNGEISSHTSLCLKALLSVISSDVPSDGTSEPTYQNIEMSSGEAQAICDSLGKKLSQMVLNHLLLNAQRNESSNCAQTKSPEIVLLCALASHAEILPQLYQNGGLEALSLVAAEGEVGAIQALCEVSKDDPKKVIEVDGHESAMQVFMDESKYARDAVISSIDLLVNICTKSKITRKVVSESDKCPKCIHKARDIVTNFEESMTPLIALYDEPKPQNKNGLELSALSFLTIMNHEKICRNMIRADKKLRNSIEVLISSREETNAVSHAIIDFLGSMCCHVGELGREQEEPEYYSAESISAILLTLLKEYEISKTTCNRKILASIISAIESILCHMSTEDQTKSLSLLAVQFNSIIDQDYMIPLKMLLAQKKSSSSLILHLIISIFLRLLYKEEHHRLLREHDALSGFVKLIVIDYYIKQDNQNQIESDFKKQGKTISEEQTYWYSAVTQSLQCLALLDSASFAQNSISIAEVLVIKGVDSVNNGDSQQQCPINEALELFVRDNIDAIRFISSQKILQKLDLCI